MKKPPNIKISLVQEDLNLISKYTPINAKRVRNLYFARLLANEMNNFINQVNQILNGTR